MNHKERMFENIYDLIKGVSIPKGTKPKEWNDASWAELSKKHELEAKKELKKFIRDKNISWEEGTIRIGKHFTIKLVQGKEID